MSPTRDGSGSVNGTATLQRTLTKVDRPGARDALRRSGAKDPAGHIAAAAAYDIVTQPGPQMLRKLPASPFARERTPDGTTTRIGFARAGVTFSSRAVRNDANKQIGTDKSWVARLGYSSKSIHTIRAKDQGLKVREKTTVREREQSSFGAESRRVAKAGSYWRSGTFVTLHAHAETAKNPLTGRQAKSSATADVTEYVEPPANPLRSPRHAAHAVGERDSRGVTEVRVVEKPNEM